MKAHLKAFGGRLTIEVEGADQKELFMHIAGWHEILSEQKCGLCGSDRIRFQYQLTQAKDAYYRLHCDACRAEFNLGQRKEPKVLFPKRLADDKKPLPHGGWSKYDPTNHEPSEPPTPARTRTETNSGVRGGNRFPERKS